MGRKESKEGETKDNKGRKIGGRKDRNSKKEERTGCRRK